MLTCKDIKLDLCPSPCTKISSQWIKDFNVKSETQKPLGEFLASTLQHIQVGKDTDSDSI